MSAARSAIDEEYQENILLRFRLPSISFHARAKSSASEKLMNP